MKAYHKYRHHPAFHTDTRLPDSNPDDKCMSLLDGHSYNRHQALLSRLPRNAIVVLLGHQTRRYRVRFQNSADIAFVYQNLAGRPVICQQQYFFRTETYCVEDGVLHRSFGRVCLHTRHQHFVALHTALRKSMRCHHLIVLTERIYSLYRL